MCHLCVRWQFYSFKHCAFVQPISFSTKYVYIYILRNKNGIHVAYYASVALNIMPVWHKWLIHICFVPFPLFTLTNHCDITPLAMEFCFRLFRGLWFYTILLLFYFISDSFISFFFILIFYSLSQIYIVWWRLRSHSLSFDSLECAFISRYIVYCSMSEIKCNHNQTPI